MVAQQVELTILGNGLCGETTKNLPVGCLIPSTIITDLYDWRGDLDEKEVIYNRTSKTKCTKVIDIWRGGLAALLKKKVNHNHDEPVRLIY